MRNRASGDDGVRAAPSALGIASPAIAFHGASAPYFPSTHAVSAASLKEQVEHIKEITLLTAAMA